MSNHKRSLKTNNAKFLWLFIGVNFAVFLSVSFGAQLTYGSIEHFWQRISEKNGLIALCIPLATIALNGFISDVAKARLVFWRWKDPLPGCRLFSELIKNDPRINVPELKKKHGAFPRSPKDQNALWFKIYKMHSESLTVYEAHRNYLLTRDLASLSVIFTLTFPLFIFYLPIRLSVAFLYFAMMLGQYLLLAISSSNYGKRFVLNVLTEESHLA